MARSTFKGGIAKLLDKEWFWHNAEKWVVDAKRWVVAAPGVPIKYYVADQELADALTTLLKDRGITGIKVIVEKFGGLP
jgi:hypothetical protein